MLLFKDYFDVIGMILLNINVVMLPFGLAWADVGARFSNVVSLISVGYWSLEMILSFVRPYERDGVTISDCRVTSLHYGQRSFILDLLIFKHRVDLHCFEPHGRVHQRPPRPSSRLRGS